MADRTSDRADRTPDHEHAAATNAVATRAESRAFVAQRLTQHNAKAVAAAGALLPLSPKCPELNVVDNA